MTQDNNQYETGKHVMRCRQELGYSRKRFGMMLGFTELGARRNMQHIECGHKKISGEKLDKVNNWIFNGVPNDAPDPNLHVAKAKYFKNMRAQNTPRVIILKGK